MKPRGRFKHRWMSNSIRNTTNASRIRWISPRWRRKCAIISTPSVTSFSMMYNWSWIIVNITMKTIVLWVKQVMFCERFSKHDGQNNSVEVVSRLSSLLSCAIVNTTTSRENQTRSFLESLLLLLLSVWMKTGLLSCVWVRARVDVSDNTSLCAFCSWARQVKPINDDVSLAPSLPLSLSHLPVVFSLSHYTVFCCISSSSMLSDRRCFVCMYV